eukprot:m.63928 g.63928  ORF g.63928 m.63928 type:complete len:641 (+) comp15861_c0_seq8:133-2055(+)
MFYMGNSTAPIPTKSWNKPPHQQRNVLLFLQAVIATYVLLIPVECTPGSGQSTEDKDVEACQVQLATDQAKVRPCTCPPNITEPCDYECSEGYVLPNSCANGTLSEPCVLSCPALVLPNTGDGTTQCENRKPCETCLPTCKAGYYYKGQSNICHANSSGWDVRGSCRYIGVHRVGLGVYVLNVADISVADASFYVDFILTVLTEDKSFESYEDVMDTFGDDRVVRECSPLPPEAAAKDLNGPVTAHLGSGANNSYQALSPTQFLASINPMYGTVDPDRLSMSFITMGQSVGVTKLQYNADTTNWRVQGRAFFRPGLQSWPFDSQKLEIMIEDLELTLQSNVSFVFCHLSTYSGLSPTIRFPDHQKQLGFGVQVAELCWPPFNGPGERQQQFADTLGSQSSCASRGGRFASSRYNAYLTYTAPNTQRFMKTYLPVCIINFIAAMSYVLPVEDYSQRITICVGTLTALVLFHVSLETQLPSSEAITLADWVLIYSYALNFSTWLITISLMLMYKHEIKHAHTINQYTTWGGPCVIVVVTSCICSFSASDFAHPVLRFVGMLCGAVVLALGLRYLVHRFQAHGGRLRRRRRAKRRSHPTQSIRMEAMGGGSGIRHRHGSGSRRGSDAYEDEDDSDTAHLMVST